MSKARIIKPHPGFIIPTRRFVDVGMPKSGVSMSGKYQIRVLDSWGIEKRRTPWFDNIILNSGLNRWGTGNIIGGAAIGTGTSTPVATDTGLETQSHWTATAGTGDGISAGISPNYNNTRTFIFRTTLGALNGNYTEVGVGWASGSNMFSRALILDGVGTPTTLSVSLSEQLDIVYQLSLYPPIVDIGPTTITMSGVDYDVIGRASQVTSTSTAWTVPESIFALNPNLVYSAIHPGTIGAITGAPSGTSATFNAAVADSYSNNSMTATGTLSAGLTSGNVAGGIMSVRAGWASIAQFQYQFDPVIPKDGTKTLALKFSITWARR